MMSRRCGCRASSRRGSAALELHALGAPKALRRAAAQHLRRRSRRVGRARRGEQACAPRRTYRISGAVARRVRRSAARFARPRRAHWKIRGGAVAVTALPLQLTLLRDVTCVVVTERVGARGPQIPAARLAATYCAEEPKAARATAEAEAAKTLAIRLHHGEEELRATPACGYAPMRFTRRRAAGGTVRLVRRRRRRSTADRRRGGDVVFLRVAPSSWAPTSCRCSARRRCDRASEGASAPRPSIRRWCAPLVARLELDLDRTLCVHWRGEASSTPARSSATPPWRDAESRARAGCRRRAASTPTDRVLVVSNARFEALEELLRRLRAWRLRRRRDAAAAQRTAFGLRRRIVLRRVRREGGAARAARWFLGSFGSTFSRSPRCARARSGRRSGWGAITAGQHRGRQPRGRGPRPRNASRASGGPVRSDRHSEIDGGSA